MALPRNLTWNDASPKWASQLDPVLANPINAVKILTQVQLSVGTNVINHLLGRTLQGWFFTRQRGLANVYDAQDSNQMPHLTLVLISDAAVSVDIGVF